MISNNNLIRKKRNNSAIEILRVILLFFLLFTHIGMLLPTKYTNLMFLDIEIIHTISWISVDAFAMITGIFIYTKRSLLSRNISRLIFIIIFSIIFSAIVYYITNKDFMQDWGSIFSGSQFAWYLYAIIVVYALAPILEKYINKIKPMYLIGIAFLIVGLIWLSNYTKVAGGFFGLQAVYSSLNIFAMTLIGRAIKEIKFKWSIAIALLLPTLVIRLIPTILRWTTMYNPSNVNRFWDLQDILHELLLSHTAITTISLSFILIWTAYNIKWYSKKVNYIVKQLYFVYEYHWLFYLLFNFLFKEELEKHTHEWLYYILLLTFTCSSFISIILSPIQFKIWDPFIIPKLEKIRFKIKSIAIRK